MVRSASLEYKDLLYWQSGVKDVYGRSKEKGNNNSNKGTGTNGFVTGRGVTLLKADKWVLIPLFVFRVANKVT